MLVIKWRNVNKGKLIKFNFNQFKKFTSNVTREKGNLPSEWSFGFLCSFPNYARWQFTWSQNKSLLFIWTQLRTGTNGKITLTVNPVFILFCSKSSVWKHYWMVNNLNYYNSKSSKPSELNRSCYRYNQPKTHKYLLENIPVMKAQKWATILLEENKTLMSTMRQHTHTHTPTTKRNKRKIMFPW